MGTGEWLTLIAAILTALGLVGGALFQQSKSNTAAIRQGLTDRITALKNDIEVSRDNADSKVEAVSMKVEAFRSEALAEVKVVIERMAKLHEELTAGFSALNFDTPEQIDKRLERTDAGIAKLHQELGAQFRSVQDSLSELQQHINVRAASQAAELSQQKGRVTEVTERVTQIQDGLAAIGRATGSSDQ